jgi:hypothetical protein
MHTHARGAAPIRRRGRSRQSSCLRHLAGRRRSALPPLLCLPSPSPVKWCSSIPPSRRARHGSDRGHADQGAGAVATARDRAHRSVTRDLHRHRALLTRFSTMAVVRPFPRKTRARCSVSAAMSNLTNGWSILCECGTAMNGCATHPPDQPGLIVAWRSPSSEPRCLRSLRVLSCGCSRLPPTPRHQPSGGSGSKGTRQDASTS